MENNSLVFFIPSDSHIEELRKKGIDIEEEMTRLVLDTLKEMKNGKEMRAVGIGVTKEQMNELGKYGIDGPVYIAAEFKKELHRKLTKTK